MGPLAVQAVKLDDGLVAHGEILAGLYRDTKHTQISQGPGARFIVIILWTPFRASGARTRPLVSHSAAWKTLSETPPRKRGLGGIPALHSTLPAGTWAFTGVPAGIPFSGKGKGSNNFYLLRAYALSPSPRPARYCARPWALMFFAALASRWWVAPHLGQVQACRL